MIKNGDPAPTTDRRKVRVWGEFKVVLEFELERYESEDEQDYLYERWQQKMDLLEEYIRTQIGAPPHTRLVTKR